MRQRNLLWRVCSGFRFSVAWTVEDAMQEVVSELWKSYRHYRGECSERTWTYRIAMNTMSRLYRRTSNRRQPNVEPCTEPSTVSSGEWHLRMYIDSFGEPDSTIFNAYLDGFSNDEIAEMSGLTANAVSMRLHRRKKQIREEYGK